VCNLCKKVCNRSLFLFAITVLLDLTHSSIEDIENNSIFHPLNCYSTRQMPFGKREGVHNSFCDICQSVTLFCQIFALHSLCSGQMIVAFYTCPATGYCLPTLNLQILARVSPSLVVQLCKIKLLGEHQEIEFWVLRIRW
jgi:hypothetical protein